MKVYQAINAVQAAMSKEGIAKGRKNQQQGYAFRGIDDVYASLSPHLSANKLCILPRVMSSEVREKETKSGGALFYTTLMVEFDFVSAEDGSKHTICTVGEAMDSGDKSSNKAMSAAYKYACFLAFSIPTEGDNDADLTTHEVKPTPTKKEPYKAKGPLASKETVAALQAHCGDVKKSTKLQSAMDARNVLTFDELSEEDAQKLLSWISTQTNKTQ